MTAITEATATETAATPAAEAPPAPKAEFDSMAGRVKTIPLAAPIRFNGQRYAEVTIRKVTGRELLDYVKALGAGAPQTYPGVELPPEVYDALDADDFDNVNRELADFLPQSLREAKEPDPQASGN